MVGKQVTAIGLFGGSGRMGEAVAALLAADLRAMTSPAFELFLEEVFRLRGYAEVRRTKAIGGQGVDMIVGDGTERVAIRARLSQGPVGNDAVQQVFAGMVHYRCQRCAVIC